MNLRFFTYKISDEFRHADVQSFLQQLARGKNEIELLLKEDATTCVWRSQFDGQALVIKRYNTKNTWHAIRRPFRKSRAENCWNMTQSFNQAGILTAARIATIQEWFGPFKGRSWFISEFIEGETLVDYFEKWSAEPGEIPELADIQTHIQQLFNKLRESKLSHGDFKASNILYANKTLYLIDLDAAHQHSSEIRFEKAHDKDRKRFLKNWRKQEDIYQAFKPLV